MAEPGNNMSHQLYKEHQYEDMILPGNYRPAVLDRIGRGDLDMSGDILVVSYPKTGTTWVEEMVWLIHTNGDIEGSTTIQIAERVQFLERSPIQEDKLPNIDIIQQQPHPRLIKSHLPARFFTKQLQTDLKFIVGVRNPKDTMVSMYHFYQMSVAMGNFEGTWDEFFELYKKQHMFYGDYFDWYMSWILFLKQSNVILIKYEDMKADLSKVVTHLAEFMGKHLSPSTLELMLSNLTFKKMKDNKMTNYEGVPYFKSEISPFMRKGIVGDWKNYFSSEQNKLFDQKYADSLEKAGMILQFE